MANNNPEQYALYLRKSQKDKELEDATGVCDTLQRHREKLLSLALDRHYPIAQIFEEVLSGDTIAERPEMRELLRAVERGLYAGVLVMEISRLARGNTRDQGVVAETFLYSGTKIITPDRIYDPAEDSDEEYLEFELFMARREYKAIHRRQQRGKMASLQEGKYIGGTAPFGYEKVKLPKQKGSTLIIVPENAQVVRNIFSLYTLGELQEDGTRRQYGAYSIANLLNQRGIPSPSGKAWTSSSVKEILTNPTYAGYIRWGYRAPEKQMQDGVVLERRPVNKNATLVRGIHEALISSETWESACLIRSKRSHAPLSTNLQLTNPLAGLVYCAHCGRSMVAAPQRNSNPNADLLLKCPTPHCLTVSASLRTVEESILEALTCWFGNYPLTESSSSLPHRSSNLSETERELSRLRSSLSTLKTQQNALHDLLEQGLYGKEVFLERTQIIAEKQTGIQESIERIEHALIAERMLENSSVSCPLSLKDILGAYQGMDSPKSKNQLLKAALSQVVYSKTTGGRWRQGNLQLYLFPNLERRPP